MASLTIRQDNNSETITVSNGQLISDALGITGHHISTPCGKKGTCGKCRVLAKGELSPLSLEEKRWLSSFEIKNGVRLACQAQVLGDAEVTLQNKEGASQIQGGHTGLTAKSQPLFSAYGAAIDIGTTTLAAQLYNKEGLVASAGRKNPQQEYGADVISRIEASIHGEAEGLAQKIQSALAGMLLEMAQKANILPHAIEYVVITGNTAMLYLLTKENPTDLSAAPFLAKRLFGEQTLANSFGFALGEQAKVYLSPCVSAFVGADLVTASLASGLAQQDKISLLVDIGTNGEMGLWKNGKLLCCSTAAGPAFEGAGLQCGMPGMQGAIDKVTLQDQRLAISVLGDVPALGICGSGVVDALAALSKAGVLDETGILEEEGHPFENMVRDFEGEPAFFFTSTVMLTQRDIRRIQLAKSAIHAGICTLLHQAEIGMEQVETLWIAGGFGSFLNLSSASYIGLIPPALEKSAKVLGNGALTGAAMLLLDKEKQQLAEQLAAGATTFDLSTSPYFMEQYVQGMMF